MVESNKFLVLWKNGEERLEPAINVIMDYPQQALRNMWDYHQHSERMRSRLQSWGPGILRRVGYEDWMDIESHTRNMNWLGSVDDNMPVVTSIVVDGEDSLGVVTEMEEGGRRQRTLK